MTSETAQIQAIIDEINSVLSKASPRLPWVLSSDAAHQRRVLEQTRNYLMALQDKQAEEQSQVIEAPEQPSSGESSESSAQQVLQAVLQEMNYLRANVLQPLRMDVERLQRERSSLAQDVRQLEAQRQEAMPEQMINQRQIIDQFLQALMARLQEYLTTQVAQTISNLDAQSASEGRSLTGEPQSALSGSSSPPALTPAQRLEQVQELQARSDQLLLKLDSTLRVIFDSLQNNIQGYQDSLGQGLEKMHNLGQQGEAMFSALVNRLAQQLGREASSYLQSSFESADWEPVRSGTPLPGDRANPGNKPSPQSPLAQQPTANPTQSSSGRRDDEVSDAEIDLLLNELRTSSPAQPQLDDTVTDSPVSSQPLGVGPQDDATVFQMPNPLVNRQDEDMTVFQFDPGQMPDIGEVDMAIADLDLPNAPKAEEPLELDSQSTVSEEQTPLVGTDSDEDIEALNPFTSQDFNVMDSALDLMSAAEYKDDAEDDANPEGAAGTGESDRTSENEANLDDDDFYLSLFGQQANPETSDIAVEANPETAWFDSLVDPSDAIGDPSSRSASVSEEPIGDSTADLADRENLAAQEIEQSPLAAEDYPLSSEDPSPAEASVESGRATDPDIDAESLATVNQELFGTIDDTAPPSAQPQVAPESDEDPIRDETLSGLSTQSLAHMLLPDEEPLFPAEMRQDDDGSEQNVEAISSLTDLIGDRRLSGEEFLGDDDSEGDRYVAASPDENLLNTEDSARPGVDLDIDDSTLNVLSNDLSQIEGQAATEQDIDPMGATLASESEELPAEDAEEQVAEDSPSEVSSSELTADEVGELFDDNVFDEPVTHEAAELSVEEFGALESLELSEELESDESEAIAIAPLTETDTQDQSALDLDLPADFGAALDASAETSESVPEDVASPLDESLDLFGEEVGDIETSDATSEDVESSLDESLDLFGEETSSTPTESVEQPDSEQLDSEQADPDPEAIATDLPTNLFLSEESAPDLFSEESADESEQSDTDLADLAMEDLAAEFSEDSPSVEETDLSSWADNADASAPEPEASSTDVIPEEPDWTVGIAHEPDDSLSSAFSDDLFLANNPFSFDEPSAFGTTEPDAPGEDTDDLTLESWDDSGLGNDTDASQDVENTVTSELDTDRDTDTIDASLDELSDSTESLDSWQGNDLPDLSANEGEFAPPPPPDGTTTGSNFTIGRFGDIATGSDSDEAPEIPESESEMGMDTLDLFGAVDSDDLASGADSTAAEPESDWLAGFGQVGPSIASDPSETEQAEGDRPAEVSEVDASNLDAALEDDLFGLNDDESDSASAEDLIADLEQAESQLPDTNLLNFDALNEDSDEAAQLDDLTLEDADAATISDLPSETETEPSSEINPIFDELNDEEFLSSISDMSDTQLSEFSETSDDSDDSNAEPAPVLEETEDLFGDLTEETPAETETEEDLFGGLSDEVPAEAETDIDESLFDLENELSDLAEESVAVPGETESEQSEPKLEDVENLFALDDEFSSGEEADVEASDLDEMEDSIESLMDFGSDVELTDDENANDFADASDSSADPFPDDESQETNVSEDEQTLGDIFAEDDSSPFLSDEPNEQAFDEADPDLPLDGIDIEPDSTHSEEADDDSVNFDSLFGDEDVALDAGENAESSEAEDLNLEDLDASLTDWLSDAPESESTTSEVETSEDQSFDLGLENWGNEDDASPNDFTESGSVEDTDDTTPPPARNFEGVAQILAELNLDQPKSGQSQPIAPPEVPSVDDLSGDAIADESMLEDLFPDDEADSEAPQDLENEISTLFDELSDANADAQPGEPENEALSAERKRLLQDGLESVEDLFGDSQEK